MTDPSRPLRLTPEQGRWTCDPAGLPFETTEEIPCCEGIIGQDRAIEAIRLGLEVESRGYNIFVCGEPGTGRTTSVKHLLESAGEPGESPPDIVYVNNFKNPDLPVAILMPSGQGTRLRDDMRDLILHVRTSIQQIFESEAYKERTKEVIERYKESEKELIRLFEERIKAEKFALIQVQMGPFSKPEIAPLIDGEPHMIERLETSVREEKFSPEEFRRLKEKAQELTGLMETTFRKARELKRSLRQELAELEKEFGRPAVDDYLDDLRRAHPDPMIHEYLDGVREAILGNMEQFTERDGEEQPTAHPEVDAERYLQYQVNVLVDNSGTKGRPVVVETSPNYRNLFGTIERVVDRSGHWRSDFTHVKAGTLLRANGGFLVLNLYDFIGEPGVWSALKRTLKNRQVDIQGYDPLYLFSTSALKPSPIPVRLRVVVIGDALSYRILYEHDPDFRKIFKVKADFDSTMPLDPTGIDLYARFVRKIQSEEKLNPFDRGAVAAVIEHGARLAGRRSKLTTRFSPIADLIREAAFCGRRQGRAIVSAQHVREGIDQQIRRVNLIEDKIKELIQEGTLIVDSQGSRVGQVNGLSVLDLGDHMFGRPTRITAKVSVGNARIVNIERESELSGRTHDKGVLILEGFLREHFAQDKPMAVTASICFEQSYSGVDGDSASSAEVYALLSSLSGLPLRQDLAVTGSVNQHGEIQPIGGVNEKIEGFFDVCAARGLTGTQGVLIPARNVEDLMLRPAVVEAMREGRFHVYGIGRAQEGIELLTGVSAGERSATGSYPEGSVFALADGRIRQFSDTLRAHRETPSQGTGEKGRRKVVDEAHRPA